MRDEGVHTRDKLMQLCTVSRNLKETFSILFEIILKRSLRKINVQETLILGAY